MIATTLTEAVSQIVGRKVTEGEAMHFAYKNYMELRFFTRHEDSIISEKKLQQQIKSEKSPIQKRTYKSKRINEHKTRN